MNTSYLIVAAAASLLGTPAFADPVCSDAPQDDAAVAATMRQLVDSGHMFTQVEIDAGKCYELKATGKDGSKREIHLNPADGRILESKTKTT